MESLIEPARASDLPAIVALLEQSGLPTAGVAEHLDSFTVAREEGRIAGVIGLEVRGQRGLLRSLTVAPDRRRHGIAMRLYAKELALALKLQLTELYLLTTTAQPFFELLGWTVLSREEVPAEIAATDEFRALCPATAICMMRAMPRE